MPVVSTAFRKPAANTVPQLTTDEQGFVRGILLGESYHTGGGPALKHPPLSQSLAKLMVQGKPEDAWRVANGEGSDVDSAAKDSGTVLDAILVGAEYARGEAHTHAAVGKNGKPLAAVSYEDWATLRIIDAESLATNSAKEVARDARESGRTVVTRERFESDLALAKVLAARLELAGVDLLSCLRHPCVYWVAEASDGTLVQCRGELDFFDATSLTVIDLKRLASLAPWAVERSMSDYGWACQCAAYSQAIYSLYNIMPAWRWLFVREHPVLAVSYRPPAASLAEVGNDEWQYAVDCWAKSLTAKVWAGWELDHEPIEATPRHIARAQELVAKTVEGW